MIELLQRLWQRKLVQWMLAYIAAAFALIQVVDVVGGHFGWPATTGRFLILALAAGFFVALVLSWYHGERGAQRFGGGELLIIALLLAIGGFAVGHFGPLASVPQAAPDRAATAPTHDGTIGSTSSVAPRSMGNAMQAMVAQPIPAKSIAVLPFENLSSDKDNEYFVSGMQDLILAKLGDIGELKVISRTSTMQYKSRPGNLKKVAAELGVATILEGSVQKQGKQVLINVQLIDARSDAHLWAETYQRTLDNIFGVEGEVADKIATALNTRLSTAQSANLAAVPTSSPAAYDAFLRAEFLIIPGRLNGDPASFKAAVPLYHQAIATDPHFALAYARLSFSEGAVAWYGGVGEDQKQLTQQAHVDAEQSLKLGPDLAAAHVALGFSYYHGRRDYPAALKEFDAALALSPNDVEALAARGYVQRRQGRIDEAIASLQQALVHDPRSSKLTAEIGGTFMLVGRYAEAENWSQRALTLDPRSLTAKAQYANSILLDTGDIPRALAAVQGDAPGLKVQRVYLLSLQRQFGAAVSLLESVPDASSNNFGNIAIRFNALLLADLYRLAGDNAKARPLYEQGLSEARARLGRQEGINLAFAWQGVATAELGLGNTAKGLEAIASARAIVDRSEDQFFVPALMTYNAKLYVEARRPDLAVPLLAKALVTPGIGATYSPLLLWLDPAWDPIRQDPGFQALQAKYAKSKPAVTYDASLGGGAAGVP